MADVWELQQRGELMQRKSGENLPWSVKELALPFVHPLKKA